jgi:hypothetical protein
MGASSLLFLDNLTHLAEGDHVGGVVDVLNLFGWQTLAGDKPFAVGECEILLTEDELADIFEENYRFSKKTLHPVPRSVVGAANLVASGGR